MVNIKPKRKCNVYFFKETFGEYNQLFPEKELTIILNGDNHHFEVEFSHSPNKQTCKIRQIGQAGKKVIDITDFDWENRYEIASLAIKKMTKKQLVIVLVK